MLFRIRTKQMHIANLNIFQFHIQSIKQINTQLLTLFQQLLINSHR